MKPQRFKWPKRIAAAAFFALALLLAINVRTDIPQAELLAKYTTPASSFAPIEGIQVHYRDEGQERQNTPVLLLHGSASSLHTWDAWTTKLTAHRRVIRLDLPGFGLTGPAPDRVYTAARYARVVVAMLDHLGLAQVDIVGNSLGGRVALTVALNHAPRVRKLVLVDASGLSGQVLPTAFRIAKIPVLNQVLRWVTPRAVYEKNVRDVYADRARPTDALVDRYYELGRREGNRQAFVDRLSGPVDPSYDDRLAEIKAPTLILWGERDAWIPVAFAHRMHEGIAGSKLVTYPEGGHVPMEELPEPTCAEVEAFLNSGAPEK